MTITTIPDCQRILDDACRLLDDVSRSPHSHNVIAVHCLRAVQQLRAAGAVAPVGAPAAAADTTDMITRALALLASLPSDVFATSVILEATHHAQTALAATRFGR